MKKSTNEKIHSGTTEITAIEPAGAALPGTGISKPEWETAEPRAEADLEGLARAGIPALISAISSARAIIAEVTAADLRGIQYGDTDRQRLESVFRILDPLINGRALHVPVADAFSADTPVSTEPDGHREGICQPEDLTVAFQFELIPGMSETYACSICGRDVGEVTESHRTERSRTATSHQPAASSISTDERIAALIDKHLRHRSPADLVCRDELLAALTALMPNVGSR